MSHTGSRPPTRRPRYRAVALITAVTATLTGFGVQAFADNLPSQMTPPAGWGAKAGPPNGPLQLAWAKAKSTGKPVTVDELTTQTSLTIANPDGTATRTDNLRPARVKVNGSWTPVDATLTKNADGSLSPKATPSGVTLSGGGNGPLAAFADAGGHKLALTLPFALPAPTVDGDTATYTAVLPGVDLKATVSDQGAFHEILVVHDATAAANPALKSLRLATSTTGLATSADAVGNITAKTADGTTAFTAPTPVMWDSAKASRTAAPSVQSNAASAAPAVGTAPVESSDSVDSSEKGPGRAAHVSPIKVSADSGSITLTPDPSKLGGSGITWPLYIDPYVSPASGGTNHYTEVKQGCPGDTLYDQAQTNGEGVGFQQYSSSCYGMERSYYEFDTSNLTSNMVISKSTLYFTETYGADNSCSDSWPVSLALTGGISGGTSWNNQPGTVANLGSQNVNSSSPVNSCGNHPANFDVTGTIRQYAGSYSNLTFGLTGDEGNYGTNYGFMRFSTNPYIQTVFDITPNVPDSTTTTPNSQNPSGPDCNGGPAGWIGMTTLNNNTSNLNLNAHVTTQMSGVNLQAGFHVWDNMTNNGSGGPATVSWPASSWVASNTTVTVPVGFQLQNGHTYGWNSWATDGTLTSGGSSYCYFTADLTPPAVTMGTSTVFPQLGSGTGPTGHAGDSATVSVSATDPAPTGCSPAACLASGVQAFQYSLDVNVPVGGGTTVNVTPDGTGKATANIPITVPANQWGTHTLYVRAVDNAGNTAATPATYSFYAPWNPGLKVTAGDLSGDGVPDMLASTTDGNLTLIKGNSDPTVTPEIASTPTQAPDSTNHGWNNYLIAHRGSVTQQTTDDLFAYSKTSHNLYAYKSDAVASPPGTPGHFSQTQDVIGPLARPTCTANGSLSCGSYPTDWSQLTQMAAPGPLATAAYNLANPAQPLAPDLITVENKQLWYYIAGGSGSSYFYSAYPIGTGDWSITSLLGVGMTGTTSYTPPGGSPTETGGTPVLWVRNNVSGAISSFPLTFDNQGNPTTNIAAPTRASLVSGVKDSSNNNMCLDISGANTADGTHAQMWYCNGTDAQSFTLGTDNTIHALGKCLDVSNGGTGNGTPVQLWTCNNTGAQQWIPGPFAGALVNPQSGRCLADPAASNTAGTQLIIWDCLTSHVEQNWAATAANNALPATQPILALGVNSGAYPAITTPGDVNGDGNPDIYTIGTNGQIISYPGAARPVAGAADRWQLTDTTDGVNAANALTLNGGAAIGADPTRGNVLVGNGSTGYAASAATSVDTSKSFTVSAWGKLTSLTSNSTFVAQSGTSASGFQLYYSSGAHSFAFGHAWADNTAGQFTSAYGPTTGSTAPQANVWYHLAGVYDTSSNQLRLYVNGTLAATATYGGTSWNATGPLQIGRRLYTGSYGEYIAGSVSDVQTYGSALSSTSVIADMANVPQFSPATTLGYLLQPNDRWKLTDNTDAIRSSNNLSVLGSAAFTSDATRGTVLSLPGNSSSYTQTGGPVVDTTKSFTVSAWAKTNSMGGVVLGQDGNTTQGFMVWPDGVWRFGMATSDSGGWPYDYTTGGPAVQYGQWYHVVAVYDASSQLMSLYVNGALVGTTTHQVGPAFNGKLAIGRWQNSGSNANFFNGSISDVQIWNSALPAAAVATLNSGSQPVPVQLS